MMVYISRGECVPVDDNGVNPIPLEHVNMKLTTKYLFLED